MELTRFPNLTDFAEPQGKRHSWTWSLGDDAGEPSTVLTAWSRLLHAFTGDLHVRFATDDSIATADFDSDQVLVQLAPAVGDTEGKDGTCVLFQSTTRDTNGMALALFISDRGRDARLEASPLVPAAFLQQLAGYFISLLRECRGAEAPASGLPLSELNPIPNRESGPELLHDLTRNAPGPRIALDFIDADTGRCVMSYQDLHDASDRLAMQIVAVCQGTKHIIPVLIPQSPELYIVLLAILKAGCAFCPLQLDAPEGRLRFVISDTSAPAVVTTESLRTRLAGVQGAQILSYAYTALTPHSPVDLPRDVDGSDLAYVMYTSGSTGTPKGVALSHSAATQSLLSHDREIPRFSRFLQFASPTFDVSVFEIFFPWFRGVTLASCSREMLIDDLPGMMRRLDVDAAELTPTVAGNLLQRRSEVPALRLLLTIGEKLTDPVVAEFGGSEAQPSLLWGMYGPTECAIHCAVQPAFDARIKPGLLGHVFGCCSAYVISPAPDSGKPTDVNVLPVGYIGELAMGGHQLAREYLNRPEQNAKAFVDTENFGRLYRTGDLARVLPSGALEYIGRHDSSQVKLRGQRVELGEIEHAISRLPGCQTAVASIISGSLVVFCCFQNRESTPSVDAILQHSKTWLPTFMVPGSVEIIDEIPYLPSGKVDRKLLQTKFLEALDAVQGETSDPLEDETAARICTVLQQILHVRLTPDTSLGRAGLDSLQAISVASALRKEGFHLSASALLSSATVQDLINHIKERALVNGIDVENAIRPFTFDQLHPDAASRLENDDICKILPCTPLQLSMLSEMEKNDLAYWNWVKVEIPGSFPMEAVLQSFQRVVMSNEILRTSFAPCTSESVPYVQVVRKSPPKDVCVIVDAMDEADGFGGTIGSPLRILIEAKRNPTTALIRISHLLYDGWSMDLMLEDFSGFLRGESPPSRPQFSSVVDFALRPPEPAARRDAERFWIQQLNDYLFTPLPLLNPQVVGHQLKSMTSVMDSSLSDVRAAAAKLGVSPQVFFQSALAHIIQLYKGVDDVCLAWATSGRMIAVPGIEDILGPCITTLPLRLSVDGATPVSTLLTQIHQTATAILSHSSLPLSEIRRLSGFNPGEKITDVLFVWQETLFPAKDTAGAIRIIESFDYTEFSLNLEVEPRESSIFLKATYDASIFDSAQVHILLAQLERFVSFFCDNPELRFSDHYARLPPELLSFTPVRQATPPAGVLTDRISQWAADSPGRTALLFTSAFDAVPTKVSYAELEDRANRLAHAIASIKEPSDLLVCVFMDKSVEFYIAVLAVVKAGLGYLPILPDTPEARVQTILRDSQVRIHIVSDATTGGLVVSSEKALLNVDRLGLTSFPPSPPPPPSLSAPAYAIYTSGSTGVPKGVLVSQGNLLTNLEILSDIYPVSEGSRLLQQCSVAFDVSAFEIFFTWYEGMTLCSAPKDALFHDLEQAIQTFEITHLSMTPTVAALVDPVNVPTVQFLVTAGEGLTEAVKTRWEGKGLFQGYGPCETTNICTVKENVADSDAINNIGPPFKNTSVLVSSPGEFKILPRGSVGELCFGGSQVCLGYLNRPKLNAEKFLDLPQFGRVYRSGDTGRMLPDDQILFAGRSDDQVKIRGQRVELGEINHVLCSADDVRDCCSLVIAAGKGNVLVSFWVPASENERSDLLDPSTFADVLSRLFDLCVRRLPGYMVPTYLIPIGRIPQTRQGKVDRRALKADFEKLDAAYLRPVSFGSSSDADVTDWTDEEETIAHVLAEILRLPRDDILKSSSFFGMGLDSISAITVSRRLKSLGILITVSQILQFPTIASLSRSGRSLVSRGPKDGLSQIWTESDTSALHALLRGKGVSALHIWPCTALQEAMLAATSSTSPGAYCNVMRFRICQEPSKLVAAWDMILRRHDIFRTAFASTQNRDYPFAQIVLDNYVAASQRGQAACEADLDDILGHLKTTVQRRLEAIEPPHVSQVVEYQTGAVEILFCCHHALYDGEAMSLFMQEVEQFCNGESLSSPSTMEPFLEQVVVARSPESDSRWRQLLQNPAVTVFPSLAGSVVKRHQGSEIYASNLSVSVTQVDLAIRALKMPLLSLLQAAWVKVLSNCLGQRSVCFGNVVSGRSAPVPDMDRLVAPCFNTVPVHVKLNDRQTNLELVESLRRFTADSRADQLSPLRRILSLVQSVNQPLFDSLFLLQSGPYRLDEQIWTLEEDSGWMDFPLVVEITPDRHGNALGVQLHYSLSKLERSDAIQLSNMLSAALESIIESPHEKADDLESSASDWSRRVRERATIDRELVKPQDPGHSTEETGAKGVPQEISGLELRVLEHLARFTTKEASHISPSTTVFQLGLDSISVVQLASLLRKDGLNISSLKILELQTTAAISRFLFDRGDESAPSHTDFDFEAFDSQHRLHICRELNLASSKIEKIRPCTPLQNGILAQFLQSNGDLYFNQYSVRLRDGLDEESLQHAWKQVQEDSEMLRTGFIHVGGSDFPFAMITYTRGSMALPWTVQDATDAQVGLRRPQGGGLYFAQNFHIPGWRLRVERRVESTVLHIDMLHGLYDANSIAMIFEDVSLLVKGSPVAARPSIEGTLCAVLQQPNAAESETFWKKQDLRPTKFPNLCPYQSTGPMKVAEITCRIPLHTLTEACKAANVTLQAMGQVAWAQVLGAYTGEDRVSFGVVLSGRNTEEAQTVPFPTFATVPISLSVNREPHQCLRDAAAFNSQVLKHQHVGLGNIKSWAGLDDRTLFDTLFAFQQSSVHGTGLDFGEVIHEQAMSEFVVSVEILPADSGLIIRLTYQSNTLPEPQALILLHQMDDLLARLAHPGECTLSPAVYSITAAKDERIDADEALLHQFVEQRLESHANVTALEFASEIINGQVRSRIWTYEELDNAANRVANMILDAGVPQGSLVGICFNKCPQASIAIVGILKSGCGYVALDPSAPPARKNFILEDSHAPLLLTTDDLLDELSPPPGVRVTALADEHIGDAKFPSPQLARPIEPSDVAYCLYTSGTTGTPKGCEITHDNSVQAIKVFQRIFAGHWNERSRWLQFASFHFDVSVLEQFWSWSVGICVVSAPRDVIFEDLAGSIRSLRITHIDLTPSLARLIRPEDVPSLCEGVFITGGEKLRQDVLDAWGPAQVVYNGYGPTEATIGVTMLPRVPSTGKPGNIGPQFDNVGSFVFTPGTEIPVLRGGVGELCVSGPLVGKGYLNRPELTEQKFPYLPQYGVRVYRTGDLVRILHDGTFDFLGRQDDQVKLRGQRLEIAEINAVITQHVPEIRDIATLVLKHPQMQREQLVSFVVREAVKSGEADHAMFSLDARARSACRNFLPPYMIPTYFVPLDVLPLSVNNKLNENQLKEYFGSLSLQELQGLNGSGRPEKDQMTVQELQLGGILREMLENRVEDILPSSNIFELGLDSISVIELARRIRQANLGRPSIQALMQLQTIRAISSALTNQTPSKPASDAAAISAKQLMSICKHRHVRLAASALGCTVSDLESIAPCTPLQEGMIATSLKNPAPVYFAQFRFEIRETAAVSRVKAAWKQAQSKLQVLRTSFVQGPSGYIQAVVKERQLPWREITVPESISQQGLQEQFQGWHQDTPVRLIQPFELVLVTSGPRMLLVLHIFHGLYDGISLRLMLQGVLRAYEAPSDLQFGPDFHNVLPFGPLSTPANAKAFWTSHLASTKGVLDHQIRSGKSRALKLSSKFNAVASVEQLRKSLKVTTQAVVQTAWAVAMNKVLRRTSPLVLGLVVSGRSIDFGGADKVVGPLFNTIPFSLQFESGDTWRDLIHRCHSFNLSVLPFQHTPLRSIHKWTQVHSNQSLFDTLLVFQTTTHEDGPQSQNVWTQAGEETAAHYPLSLDIELSRESMSVDLVSDESIHDESQLRNLHSEFLDSIHAMLVHIDSSIDYHIPTGVTHNLIENQLPTGAVTNGHVREPGSGKLQVLRDIVGHLIGIDPAEISSDISIVDLGLDSIDAIRLSSQLRQAGYTISVSEIMRSRSVAGIAALLTSLVDQAGDEQDAKFGTLCAQLTERIQIQHPEKSIRNVFPASPLQEGMLVHMISSGYRRYLNHEVLQLSSDTDVDIFRQAWAAVASTTEALRISFVELGDPTIPYSFVQAVQDKPTLKWSTEILDEDRHWPMAVEDAKRSAVRNAEDGRFFSLCLIETPERKLLVLSLAHALYDGWSIGLLHADVQAAYHGRMQPRPSIGSTIQTILRGDNPESQSFWRDYLTEYIPSPIPPGMDMGESGVIRQDLVSDLPASKLKTFCRSVGITMQTLTHTCMAMVLASRSASLKTVHGVVLSGRDDPTSSEVMFPTMTTVPLRTFVHGTVRSMLEYMHENLGDVSQHQHYPLRKIQGLVEGKGGPLFDALFIYQARAHTLADTHERLYETIDGDGEVEFGVAAEAEIVDQELLWRMACSASAFDAAAVEQFLKDLEGVLQFMVEFSDSECFTVDADGIAICGLRKFSLASEPVDETESQEHNQPPAVNGGTWSDLEISIRQVLSSVAGIPEDDIFKNSTFSSLGLDSISAIKVSKLLRNRGIHLSVGALLRASMVSSMAEVSSKDASNGSIQPSKVDWVHTIQFGMLPGIEPEDVEDVLPATSGQVSMLTMWQNSHGRLFWPTFSYSAPRTFGREQIGNAWVRLMDEEPILRTRFVAGDTNMPVMQVVLRSDSSRSKANQLANLTIVEKADAWELKLSIHHALYDAVSLPILMQRLSLLCKDSAQPRGAPDGAFRQYVDETSTGDAREKARRFWSAYLEGAQNPLLPASTSAFPRRVEFFEPNFMEGTNVLEKKARADDVSVHHLLLAAYTKAYSHLLVSNGVSHPQEIVFGVYLANRSHDIPGLTESTSPTLNMVPLRVSVGAQGGLSVMAKKIQGDLLEMSQMERAAVGLWEVEQWTGVRLGSFVNILNLPNADESTDVTDNIRAVDGEETRYRRVVEWENTADDGGLRQMLEKNRVRAAYLPSVDLEVRIINGRLQVGVFCDEDLLDLDGVERLVEHVRSLLLQDVV